MLPASVGRHCYTARPYSELKKWTNAVGSACSVSNYPIVVRQLALLPFSEKESLIPINTRIALTQKMTTSSIEDEQSFRERYSKQLRELKGERELHEERQQVKRQEMKTPRRRGEEIKHEEIDREITRRYFKSNNAGFDL